MEVLLENLNNVEQSNNFLRALWANIRADFGKCAWHYSPYRVTDKKTIVLGSMNYRDEGTIEVSLRYKKKGNLVAIIFKGSSELDSLSQDLAIMKQLVKKSLRYSEQRKIFHLKTYFDVIRGNISPYSSEVFQLTPVSSNKLRVTVRVFGYDNVDAKSIASHKFKVISEIISVFTNFLLIRSKTETNESFCGEISYNKYADDVNWVDDKPTFNNLVQLSEKACKLIDLILNTETESPNLKLLLSAYRHFYSARSLDAFEQDALYFGESSQKSENITSIEVHKDERFALPNEILRSSTENASVLYMSSLEVASLFEKTKIEKCNKCNQNVYSISARVQDFVKSHSESDWLVTTIKSYYNLRSRHLHQGMELKNDNYLGTSLPALDLDSQSHAKEPYQVSVLNLREWSSFLLRQLLETNSVETFG